MAKKGNKRRVFLKQTAAVAAGGVAGLGSGLLAKRETLDKNESGSKELILFSKNNVGWKIQVDDQGSLYTSKLRKTKKIRSLT